MRPGILSRAAQKSVRAAIIAMQQDFQSAFEVCLVILLKTVLISSFAPNGWNSRFGGVKRR